MLLIKASVGLICLVEHFSDHEKKQCSLVYAFYTTLCLTRWVWGLPNLVIRDCAHRCSVQEGASLRGRMNGWNTGLLVGKVQADSFPKHSHYFLSAHPSAPAETHTHTHTRSSPRAQWKGSLSAGAAVSEEDALIGMLRWNCTHAHISKTPCKKKKKKKHRKTLEMTKHF